MKEERITNPKFVERAVIESKIAEGYHVILQFDSPCYTSGLLAQINNLCGELGQKLAVRFYGHYTQKFDADNLKFLPDVTSLWIDCLREVTHLSNLSNLANLRQLSLGIYKLDDPNILKSIQIKNLERLVIWETVKSNIDLAPLAVCSKLTDFSLSGQTKNIGVLTKLPNLRVFGIKGISKRQSLEFVCKIESLRRLVIILGGRTSISEIYHKTLEELEIKRVLGFDNFESVIALPALRSLVIEDQIRLENVLFSEANNKIKSIRIWNCKKLRTLKGLHHLTELEFLSIGQTELEIDEILQQHLSTSLEGFVFGSNTRRKSEEISKKLAALGYSERLR